MMTKTTALAAVNLPSTTFNLTRFVLPALALAALLLMLFMPEMALAADADVETEMNTGLKYLKFFFELFLWAVLGIAFMMAGYWIIGSITDWRNNEKNGSVGNIVLTTVISLMAVGIVGVLVAKGLTIVEDNIKDSISYHIELPQEIPSHNTVSDRAMIS